MVDSVASSGSDRVDSAGALIRFYDSTYSTVLAKLIMWYRGLYRVGGARFCSARPGIYYARMRFAWGRDAQILLHHDHFLQEVMKGIKTHWWDCQTGVLKWIHETVIHVHKMTTKISISNNFLHAELTIDVWFTEH